MDAVTRDWVMMQESVCKDTVVRKITPPEAYTKVAACMRVALVSQRTLIEAMRSPKKEQVFKLDEAIAGISRDNGECHLLDVCAPGVGPGGRGGRAGSRGGGREGRTAPSGPRPPRGESQRRGVPGIPRCWWICCSPMR
jgi:hypothetical protein